MSAAPLLHQVVAHERRYWLDEDSIQRLLDLMFCYVAGDRAFGTEEHLGWTITWETRFEPRLYIRGDESSADEFKPHPCGYNARIQAPGLVSDASMDRIVAYLEGQGFTTLVYEQEATSFEFTIGSY